MKKVSIALAMLCVASCSYAQKLELGLNAGILSSTAPKTSLNSFSSSKSTFTGAVQAAVQFLHLQAGISVGTVDLKYAVNFNQLKFESGANINQQYGVGVGEMKTIPVEAFVNKIFGFSKVEGYVGLSAGYVYVSSGTVITTASNQDTRISRGGIGAGLQVGGTFFVTKRLGINVNLAGQYYSLNNRPMKNYNLFAFPETIGVRYRF